MSSKRERREALKASARQLAKISLGLVVIQELVLWAAMDGAPRHALSFVKPWLVTSTLLAFTASACFFVVLRRVAWAAGATAVLMAGLSVVHYFKFRFLGLPLFFWDYVLIKEATRAASMLVTNPWVYAAVAIAAVALTALARVATRGARPRVALRERLALAAASVAASAIIFSVARVPYERLFPANSFRDSRVVQTGLLSFLALSARYAGNAPAPEGYDEPRMRQIVATYRQDPAPAPPAPASDAPNIIFYVVESLMDYDALGIRYRRDPMPFFNSLKASGGYGVLVSPTFGGQTVQPEFELLTGLSQFSLASPNPMAYLNADRRPFPSLCEVVRPSGYACMGLNSVTADNFQRDRAYDRMRFDSFTGLETIYALREQRRIHDRVPDELLVDTFLERMPKDRPVLAYLMTNSTHASFANWEARPEFAVVSDAGSPGSKATLSLYADAVAQADAALAKLVAELGKSDRPSVVITYGDHLPGLTEVFADLGLTQQPGWELYERHKTPVRVWSSDGRFAPRGFTISPNLMIGLLAPLLPQGAELPLQFRIARELYATYDVVSNVVVDKAGHVTPRGEAPAQASLLHDYELIEYDLLQGERFASGSQDRRAH